MLVQHLRIVGAEEELDPPSVKQDRGIGDIVKAAVRSGAFDNSTKLLSSRASALSKFASVIGSRPREMAVL
jgi:hypothetical protein